MDGAKNKFLWRYSQTEKWILTFAIKIQTDEDFLIISQIRKANSG